MAKTVQVSLIQMLTSPGNVIFFLLISLCLGIAFSQDVCNRGRICVADADCIKHRCVCRSGYGDGYFQCYDQTEDLVFCHVNGDPHLSTFPGAQSEIDIPCRHMLAHFSNSDVTTGSVCEFEINGLNAPVEQGVYYEMESEIHITATDSYGTITSFMTVINDRFGTYKASYHKRARLFDMSVDESVLLGDIEVMITYDKVDKFFIIDVPACHTSIRWRPRDSAPEQIRAQVRRPGISIATANPIFPLKNPKTPLRSELCLSPFESSTTFQDEAEGMGLLNSKLPVLRRFLEDMETHRDQAGKYAKSCTRSQETFVKCPEDRKVGALNLCGPLLSNRPLVNCLLDRKQDFVEGFHKCLQGYCQRDAKKCKEAERTFNKCDNINLDCAPLG